MFSALNSTIYVQISPERLSVRNVKTGESISEVPEMAISQGSKKAIVAVGAQARVAGNENSALVVNPFSHPRSLVSDFTVGEQLLKAFVRRLKTSPFPFTSLTMVLHPLGEPAGGYTQVEIRAFHEMGIGAGASQVIVWNGRVLMDQEIISKQFPQNGRVLV